MTTTALSPAQFAAAIQQHYIDGADDFRKVTVGLQAESRFADIYAEYAHLYTSAQLEELAQARDAAADATERDRMDRLWFDCADSIAAADVVQASQDLMNDRLAWRAEFDGEQHSINALGALLAAEPDYDRREAIYELACAADDHFRDRDIELATRSQELRAAVFGLAGEVEIAAARMGIDVERFAGQVGEVMATTAGAYAAQADSMFPAMLGRDERRPSRAHAAYLRSLHHHDDTYTRELLVPVCERTVAELGFPLHTVPTIRPDLEDRPEKDPRACVIPVRVPEEVHLVVRPTGGITDYGAFLHEAGHALHYGLASAELPFEHRYLDRDNALTEIYSYVVERITHEPLWHMRHFGLSRGEAERVVGEIAFIDGSLFRRYGAKLSYELEFWRDPAGPGMPARYKALLDDATLMTYSPSQFASDMDPGLYAADYLRAWRTSEQVLAWLRAEHGEEWFCNGAAAPFLRELFVQGTLPTNEQVSEQVGSSPDDFSALVMQVGR